MGDWGRGKQKSHHLESIRALVAEVNAHDAAEVANMKQRAKGKGLRIEWALAQARSLEVGQGARQASVAENRVVEK